MTKPSPAGRRMTGRPRQVADCGCRMCRAWWRSSRSATVGCNKVVLQNRVRSGARRDNTRSLRPAKSSVGRSTQDGWCGDAYRWGMSTGLAGQRVVRLGGEGDGAAEDQREAADGTGMSAR